MEKKIKEVVENEVSIDVKFEGSGLADEQIKISDIKEGGADAALEKYKDEPWFKKSGLESKVRKHEDKKAGDKPTKKAKKGSAVEGEEETPEQDELNSHERGEGQQLGRDVPHSEV